MIEKLAQGGLDGERALVLDLREIAQRLTLVQESFAPPTLHAAAIKANPLLEVLRRMVEGGAGLEAASIGEVHLALAAGCRPEAIVFDSPAKTREELRFALEQGVYINADNLDEIARIAELRAKLSSSSRVGLRINPQVGLGHIAATSVATRNSKFGVSLERQNDAVRRAYAEHPWLEGVHVHVGSQGCGVELLAAGVRRAVDLAREVGATTIDIGGGLPVAYRDEDEVPSMQAYVARLRDDVPEIFSGEFRVITEFGRWLTANAGVAVSRVEYVKPAADVDIVTIHFGADLLLRRCYMPETWYHRITVCDPEGRPRRDGERRRYTIAGPLCFSGDVLAKEVDLPVIEPGDLIVVHDVGAYTFSMWSRYCSRSFPRILGWDGEDFVILKEQETARDLVAFWSR